MHADAQSESSATGLPKSGTPAQGPRRYGKLRRMIHLIIWSIVLWLFIAYLVLPTLWKHYEHHPELAVAPRTTETVDHIPGDPLNVSLVGTKEEVIRAFLAAGWYPADPITLKTSLEIAETVLRGKQYDQAPVSNLYVFGRKQDLAFEKPDGKSPKRRQHVRFWRWEGHEEDGRPVWLGAATFDHSVGVSHYTGQITHHIAPDVDAERDRMMEDLADAGQLTSRSQVTGVGPTLYGRNGGGDRYYTDGEIDVGVLSAANARVAEEPVPLENPPAVKLKNRIWSWIRPWL
jgi:hypothetical protein